MDKKDLKIAARAMRKIAKFATEISINTEYSKDYNFEHDPIWKVRASLWNRVEILEELAGMNKY